MQPLLIVPNPNRRMEELTEPLFCQQFFSRPVGHNAPVPHQNHPLNLWQNIAQMMRHQHQASAFLSQSPQALAQFPLRCKVESIRWFV
jgi:hypothetical protein